MFIVWTSNCKVVNLETFKQTQIQPEQVHLTSFIIVSADIALQFLCDELWWPWFVRFLGFSKSSRDLSNLFTVLGIYVFQGPILVRQICDRGVWIEHGYVSCINCVHWYTGKTKLQLLLTPALIEDVDPEILVQWGLNLGLTLIQEILIGVVSQWKRPKSIMMFIAHKPSITKRSTWCTEQLAKTQRKSSLLRCFTLHSNRWLASSEQTASNVWIYNSTCYRTIMGTSLFRFIAVRRCKCWEKLMKWLGGHLQNCKTT